MKTSRVTIIHKSQSNTHSKHLGNQKKGDTLNVVKKGGNFKKLSVKKQVTFF